MILYDSNRKEYNLLEGNESVQNKVDNLDINNVLWDGARYMTANQTITLTNTVLSQQKGIVLVFSYYNGEEKDYDWHSFFVPKKLVELKPGTGHTFSMNSVGYGRVAAKYLYIYNDKITGSDDNKTTGTGSNIKIDNSLYVLRYVIGV